MAHAAKRDHPIFAVDGWQMVIKPHVNNNTVINNNKIINKFTIL